MPRNPTTIRLDPHLHKIVMREAEKAGLNFSSVVHVLLNAFANGTLQIGVTQYPQTYINTLTREIDALRLQHRAGMAKRYTSSKQLFDDILDR